MITHKTYLLHQFARFGVLTVPQVLRLSLIERKRTTTYEIIRSFVSDGLITKICHPTKRIYGYVATPKAYLLTYGDYSVKYRKPKELDLEHAVLCSDVMIELAHRSLVTGIASEHEIDLESLKCFCFSRIPDGIVQVKRGNLYYELAVEVELSLKSPARIKEILCNYQRTFELGLGCSGVLIIALSKKTHTQYQSHIAVLPESIRNQILLFSDTQLSTLNTKLFGERWKNSGKPLDLLRTQPEGEIEYISMFNDGCEEPQMKKGTSDSLIVVEGGIQ